MNERSTKPNTQYFWRRVIIILILSSLVALLGISTAWAEPVVHEEGFVVEL
jgi:hypothetical protein